MAEEDKSKEWAEKAQSTFSAERKEDFVVLALATITVILVLSGVIGPKFFNSLFF